MNVRSLCRLIALVFLFEVPFLHAQEPILQNLSIDEGLPSSSAYFVHNDKKGYIWVASDLGLSCFNGRKFINYSTANGLKDNSVVILAEDNFGKIWLATQDGTIYFVQGKRVQTVPGSKTVRELMNKLSGNVQSMEFDNNNDLWIGTSRDFLKLTASSGYKNLVFQNHFSKQSACVIQVLNNNRSIESGNKNNIRQIKTNANGRNFQIQIQDGSKRITSTIFIKKNEIPNQRFVSLKLRSGNLMFSYLGELYISEKNKVKLVKSFRSTILDIFEDADKNTFISLSDGEGVLLYPEGNFKNEPTRFLIGNSVGCITQDFEKGLWFTSTENGLFYIPFLCTRRFTEFKGLCESVKHVELIDGKVMAFDRFENLYTIDQQNRITKITIFGKGMKTGFLKLSKIGNEVFILGDRVFRLNTRTFQTVQQVNAVSQLPLATYQIVSDSQGNKFGLTLYLLMKELNGKWVIAEKLPEKGSSILYVHAKRKFWVGTRNGLFEYDYKSFKRIKHPLLNHERITHITQSKSGKIYVCTKNNGVFVFKEGNWKHLSIENGLTSNFCSNAFADDFGMIWISTDKGVSFFNEKKPKTIQKLDKSNGLNSIDVHNVVRRGDFLYVASNAGLIMVYIPQINGAISSRLNISRVTCNNQTTVRHKFDYSSRNLRFYIDNLSYKRLFQQSYTYRLRGYSNSVLTTTNDYIDFSNLPAGRYTLMIGNGHSHELKPLYSFTVMAPFWQKWWFITLSVAFAILLVYLFITWRLNIANRKALEKENFNRLLSESQITAIRAQMNPHFIFNAINSIQDFVLKNETILAYNYLSKFAKLIRFVLINSKEDYITLAKELETLGLYIELEQVRFKDSFDFHLNIQINELDEESLNVPNMMIQPYIENAIWHGIMPLKSKRKGVIMLSVMIIDDQLIIEIEDNGVGRKFHSKKQDADTHKSLGMQLVHEKLEILKEAYNQNYSITVIDLYDEKNLAIGTRIKLVLDQV